MFDKLREKWRKNRETKRAKDAVYTAIANSDADGVKQALDILRGYEVEDSDRAGFMRRSIDNHSLSVFKEVVAFVDDPNIEISYQVTRNDHTYTYRYSPIGYAISKICTHDISLWLANNPRVNLSDDLIDNAKKGGMQDVALVLTKRSADLKRQEAAQLDREAEKPMDGATSAEKPAPAAANDAAPAPQGWVRVAENSVAHVTPMEPLGRKITEIFNFETRERLIITENLKTGAETFSQPESFDAISAANVQRAADALKSLSGDGQKKTFSL